MKKVSSVIIAAVFIGSFSSRAQERQVPSAASNAKIIAVVNRADWCNVCKANAQRFGATLMSYSQKGIQVYLNDLTNDSTANVSKAALEHAHIYEAVTTTPRTGMGKMLKSCGIVKDKKQATQASGIVTFIDARTHKQLKQLSIASSDGLMKNTIEELLH